MPVLGRLLKNRRSGEARAAWNRPNLQGPEELDVSSRSFDRGGAIPPEHHAKNAGGRNLSPQLSWSEPPAGTARLLLVVEDTDVPTPAPAVHCVALVDPEVRELAPGALAAGRPAPGVTVLRSVLGRGYHGPAPIKGHGPHHYTFQLFALVSAPDGPAAEKARPGALLSSVAAPILARGRLIGTVER